MNIVHVYSQNLELLNPMVEGTQCHLNGSDDIERLAKSFSRYNARDVMGLIVHSGKFFTRRQAGLIAEFDRLFEFRHLPIILACDEAKDLVASGIVRVKNSRLFPVASVEGTLSDIDLDRIFATIAICSGEIYHLQNRSANKAILNSADVRSADNIERITMSDSLKDFLDTLHRGVSFEG